MQVVEFIQDSFQECAPFNWGMVLFTYGCNLSCSVCKGYNYEKVTNRENIIGTAKELIKSNVTPIHDSVIFIGGEPTIHGDKLIETLLFCKESGLKTKIFTNGMLPHVVSKINSLKLCDSWSLDFKGINHLETELGCSGSDIYNSNFRETLASIQERNLPLEIRTTFYEGNIKDKAAIVSYAQNIIDTYKNSNNHVYSRFIQQEDFRKYIDNE